MNWPKKCVVDTNVPKIANLVMQQNRDSDVSDECVLDCVDAIEHVTKNRALVLDAGDEIFDEYRQQLSMSGQPGVGDGFMKWVHDSRWSLPKGNRVKITKNGDSYEEFPHHPGLENFDISDRKFVAVANAHHQKPPILQATDSKWWGWKDALTQVGITVIFVCPDYVRVKYAKKIGK